jgi:arginine repressor
MAEDEEETTKVAVTRATAAGAADSIGGLIDDMSVQDIAGGTSGGSGAAQ